MNTRSWAASLTLLASFCTSCGEAGLSSETQPSDPLQFANGDWVQLKLTPIRTPTPTPRPMPSSAPTKPPLPATPVPWPSAPPPSPVREDMRFDCWKALSQPQSFDGVAFRAFMRQSHAFSCDDFPTLPDTTDMLKTVNLSRVAAEVELVSLTQQAYEFSVFRYFQPTELEIPCAPYMRFNFPGGVDEETGVELPTWSHFMKLNAMTCTNRLGRPIVIDSLMPFSKSFAVYKWLPGIFAHDPIYLEELTFDTCPLVTANTTLSNFCREHLKAHPEGERYVPIPISGI